MQYCYTGRPACSERSLVAVNWPQKTPVGLCAIDRRLSGCVGSYCVHIQQAQSQGSEYPRSGSWSILMVVLLYVPRGISAPVSQSKLRDESHARITDGSVFRGPHGTRTELRCCSDGEDSTNMNVGVERKFCSACGLQPGTWAHWIIFFFLGLDMQRRTAFCREKSRG